MIDLYIVSSMASGRKTNAVFRMSRRYHKCLDRCCGARQGAAISAGRATIMEFASTRAMIQRKMRNAAQRRARD
jgi:hypothetical protein